MLIEQGGKVGEGLDKLIRWRLEMGELIRVMSAR